LAGVDVRDDLQGKWQKYVRKNDSFTFKWFLRSFH
jgi:hypothetical protein